MYKEIVYRNIHNVSQNLFNLNLTEQALKLDRRSSFKDRKAK
jgi:hypothetical protein